MITYIEIKGFKSIKELKLELKPINIFLGSNGVGKSNILSFFQLLKAIVNKRLQQYVIDNNVDDLLYFGRKTTDNLFGKLVFDNEGHSNTYYFKLVPTKDGRLYIAEEDLITEETNSDCNLVRENAVSEYSYSHVLESKVPKSDAYRDNYLSKHIANIQLYHFHDTTNTSYLRKECDINDNLYLKEDGRNLPAYLYLIKVNDPIIYNRIEKTIISVTPYIDRLILEPNKQSGKEETIALRWADKGDPESNFSAYLLSDGTLRFIALTTLLLQPFRPPIIIIDEPELGLHHLAITMLASMIKMTSGSTQYFVATQSPGLISDFKPEDIVVIDKGIEDNRTIICRLNSEDLDVWLEQTCLGDMWERYIIEGGQAYFKYKYEEDYYNK